MPVVIVTSRTRMLPVTLSGFVVAKAGVCVNVHCPCYNMGLCKPSVEIWGPCWTDPTLTNLELSTHPPRPESLWPWHSEPWWSLQGKVGPAPNRRAGPAHLAKLAPSLTTGLGQLSPLLTWEKCFQKAGLTNSVANQAHIQGSELAYPEIYTILDPLECVSGLILKKRSSGHPWLGETARYLSEKNVSCGPVLMVYQW